MSNPDGPPPMRQVTISQPAHVQAATWTTDVHLEPTPDGTLLVFLQRDLAFSEDTRIVTAKVLLPHSLLPGLTEQLLAALAALRDLGLLPPETP